MGLSTYDSDLTGFPKPELPPRRGGTLAEQTVNGVSKAGFATTYRSMSVEASKARTALAPPPRVHFLCLVSA